MFVAITEAVDEQKTQGMRAMKFITEGMPKLTVTRTRRKAVINEIAEVITLYETVIKIELTLPSFVQGIKQTFYSVIGTLFFPRRIYAY